MSNNPTNGELSRIADLISLKLGLDFPPDRHSFLRNGLKSASAQSGYGNAGEFVRWLLSAPLNKQQLIILASHLTVSETYFWRESSVFEALQKNILPDLIKRAGRKRKPLRIWSAGCSTGEEPYSIAVALLRTLQETDNPEIRIIATDISGKALEVAATGIYRNWSFRNSPEWLKSTWFTLAGNQKYEILPSVKNMVSFRSSNLTEASDCSDLLAEGPFDIIFCRNVLMYFTREQAKIVSGRVTQALSDKGWLAVSSCELSTGLFPELTSVNFPGAVLFRKIPPEAHHEFVKMPQPALNFVRPGNHGHVRPAKAVLQEESAVSKSVIDQRPHHPDFEETLDDIRSLAGTGELSRALSACNRSILRHKLDPGLYFLRASILQEMDENQEAIKSLKQVVYIDPNHIMGHFTLGNLYFREGKLKSAVKYFNNALGLLKGKEGNEIPEESEGLAAWRIRDIVQANLAKMEYK